MPIPKPSEETVNNRHLLNAALVGCKLTGVEISVCGFYLHFQSPQNKRLSLLATANGLELSNFGPGITIPYEEIAGIPGLLGLF